jgi:hypothetical protein
MRMSLRGRSAVANGASIDAHLELTRASTDVAWQRAATREHALAALFEGSGPWGPRASDIAKSIGITRRTLYRWLARYRDAAATSSLVALTRGVQPGARRPSSPSPNRRRSRTMRRRCEHRFSSPTPDCLLAAPSRNGEESCRWSPGRPYRPSQGCRLFPAWTRSKLESDTP